MHTNIYIICGSDLSIIIVCVYIENVCAGKIRGNRLLIYLGVYPIMT